MLARRVPDVVTKPVTDSNNDGHATMEECVAAGAEPWSHDEWAARHAVRKPF